METPSEHYLGRVVEAFLNCARTYEGNYPDDFEVARGLLQPFIERFYPALRHYRPEVVGDCLALSYDDPQLGRSSTVHGFGLHMSAGDHPQDRDSSLGSYRDDGSYLALQAFDHFAGPNR